MRLWHFSDTHGQHQRLQVPEGIDVVIFSGDCSNHRNPALNHNEVIEFVDWFSSLKVPVKVMIAGNHDTSIEHGLYDRELFSDKGIVYLENTQVSVGEVKIWGSPYTPSFDNWSFMKTRHKIHKVWQTVPKDVNILVTHGPPRGILDMNHTFSQCGCSSLFKRVEQIKPNLHLFGHIHDNRRLNNAGTVKLSSFPTVFSNGSVVVDGNYSGPLNSGNVINFEFESR